VKLIDVVAPKVKGEICFDIINQLPEWFGISDANKAYAKQVQSEDFLAMTVNEKAIGFISVKKHNEKSAEITVMGILEAFHANGFGRILVNEMAARMKNEGVQFMTVKTLADTRECPSYEKTRRFYNSMGFVELEIINEIWGDDNPCAYMVKAL
jgi:ribosomal protein S18 acetylase RimI-like enzyme